ncbi:sugar ABC transporter permease [Clostridium thermosuccinogenes]|uniref:Sugar ABC transporter permease n=1 Tax=Clostridium thermosuccinogenes TaxID=84032 RepID=A0A2K2FNG2_9CLOT|nr:ABC transporter permease subunit [Pseudoclostridium thermosuccinogenes]AUS98868.1 sugar ABC transporter permease [Pseudoclostridium thermosuccinogenes]PNT94499.1 sugar ABC transporter permease [Pseudoclostridium thermosuccinogenes]PNU00317.1 sugar ABC transporter permease [Pseudoclostridium thermosuccinogenes]PNU01642.1 sugar ABC transporter permease [Pseudoclostridium thermosuccinogenes]
MTKPRKGNYILLDIKRNKYIYIMLLVVVAWYVIFCYVPMYGAIIAFKDYSIGKGIFNSPWVGFKHFVSFFSDINFMRVVRNTFLINIYDILWGFPAPIIMALLLNEVRNQYFKKTIQTLSYLPYFISMVVVCGIIVDFTSTNGIINQLLSNFGFEKVNLLSKSEFFRTVYISSGIWQNVGWGSIIYLAALTNISPELYESAVIDGAGRWKQLIHITLPGIASTIIVLLILRMGSIMSVGFEKIILLYNPLTYETADVIASYVYRKGLLNADYSYSTAIGLMNSVINFLFLVVSNWLSRRYTESSLW